MSYGIFAQVYDRLTENVGYVARAAYFKELLCGNDVSDGLVLDLACGTGSLSFALADLGYDVIGVDVSPDMLTVASEKRAERQSDLLFLQQDMRELDLYGTVDAAVCALDSINHLETPEDVQKTFARLHLFVRPGGLFIFDVNTEYKHRQVLADQCFAYELENAFIVWQNMLEETTGNVEIQLDFFLEEGESYFRETEVFTETFYRHEDLQAWLSDAGFAVLDVFADLTRNAPQADTQRAVYIAKRI